MTGTPCSCAASRSVERARAWLQAENLPTRRRYRVCRSASDPLFIG
jgi:hypothetical protein